MDPHFFIFRAVYHDISKSGPRDCQSAGMIQAGESLRGSLTSLEASINSDGSGCKRIETTGSSHVAAPKLSMITGILL
jgi:hypothetical protein